MLHGNKQARRGKVKEDKFLVNFKRLLINGQQYFTNAEKFEIKSGNLKEGGNGKTFFFYLARVQSKKVSFIKHKKAYNFYLYVQNFPAIISTATTPSTLT